jgi:hypothetical protein
MAALTPTQLHAVTCPLCAYRPSARSWLAADTALDDHAVAAHQAQVLPNVRQ